MLDKNFELSNAYYEFCLKKLTHGSLGYSLKCSKYVLNRFKIITHISCSQRCLRIAAAKWGSTFDLLKLHYIDNSKNISQNHIFFIAKMLGA